MELKNGYKVLYDVAANGEHIFSASKTGVFADAEEIAKLAAGEYKLVYEKNGSIYGSKTGVPTEDDSRFTEFDKIFTADADEPAVEDETENESVENTEDGPTVELPTFEEEEEE